MNTDSVFPIDQHCRTSHIETTILSIEMIPILPSEQGRPLRILAAPLQQQQQHAS
jgi:hypothetical protein